MQAIDQDIFNLLDEQPTPSRGSVIVAKPTLADPHFKRSVVVLIDHDNEKGSMGLIVNKYTGFSLHDVLPSVDNASNVPLYLGGPVKPDMLFSCIASPPTSSLARCKCQRGCIWAATTMP